MSAGKKDAGSKSRKPRCKPAKPKGRIQRAVIWALKKLSFLLRQPDSKKEAGAEAAEEVGGWVETMSPRRFNCLLAVVIVLLVVVVVCVSGLLNPPLPPDWRSLPIAIWVPPTQSGAAGPDYLPDDSWTAKELIKSILLARNYQVLAAEPDREDRTLRIVTLEVRCLKTKESGKNVLRIEVVGAEDLIDEPYADTQPIDQAFSSKHERLVRRIRKCVFKTYPLRGTVSRSSSSGPGPLSNGSEVRLDIGMSFGVHTCDTFRVLRKDNVRRCVGFLEISKVRKLDSDATITSGGAVINEGDGVEWIPCNKSEEGNP